MLKKVKKGTIALFYLNIPDFLGFIKRKIYKKKIKMVL